MAWKTPNSTYVIELDGKKLTCKPLGYEAKQRILDAIHGWNTDEGGRDVGVFYDSARQYVAGIEGVNDPDLNDFIDIQDIARVIDICGLLVRGSSLTENEAKN